MCSSMRWKGCAGTQLHMRLHVRTYVCSSKLRYTTKPNNAKPNKAKSYVARRCQSKQTTPNQTQVMQQTTIQGNANQSRARHVIRIAYHTFAYALRAPQTAHSKCSAPPCTGNEWPMAQTRLRTRRQHMGMICARTIAPWQKLQSCGYTCTYVIVIYGYA